MASYAAKLLIFFAGFVACYADPDLPFADFEKDEKPSTEASLGFNHVLLGSLGASVGNFGGNSIKKSIPVTPPSGGVPPAQTVTQTLPPVTVTKTIPTATVTQTLPPVTITASPVTQTLPPVTVTVTPPTCTPPPDICTGTSPFIPFGLLFENVFLKCIGEAVNAIKDSKPEK